MSRISSAAAGRRAAEAGNVLTRQLDVGPTSPGSSLSILLMGFRRGLCGQGRSADDFLFPWWDSRGHPAGAGRGHTLPIPLMGFKVLCGDGSFASYSPNGIRTEHSRGRHSLPIPLMGFRPLPRGSFSFSASTFISFSGGLVRQPPGLSRRNVSLPQERWAPFGQREQSRMSS